MEGGPGVGTGVTGTGVGTPPGQSKLVMSIDIMIFTLQFYIGIASTHVYS